MRGAVLCAIGMLALLVGMFCWTAATGARRVTDAGDVCLIAGVRGAVTAVPKAQMPGGRCE